MRTNAFVALTALALIIPATAFAQSAGTSYTGTSNGAEGTPSNAPAKSAAPMTSSKTTGATEAAKPGDTPGNSGALGDKTAVQHEKLGN